jgi:type I restriction enzyme, S subunit
MWRECLLGDVIQLKRGYDLPERMREPGSFPIVSSSGISGTHTIAKVKGPGVVTGRYGTLGEVYYMRDDFWPLNTSLYVTEFKGNDRRFISYWLTMQGLGSQSGAAAVPGVNRNHLHQLKVRVPDLHSQCRIASILSAYDDLIENNRRRIAILEEMARRIFEEWFVHFRAPGCEGLPLIDSAIGPIPKGWEVKRLGHVLDLKYGKALKADQREDGPFPVYGSSGVVGTHSSFLVKGPGIIVGRKGNVGSVHWSEQSFYPIDTVFFVGTALPLPFVYHLLRRQRFLNSDAAVPGLNRSQALAIEVVQPGDELLGLYARITEPIFKLRQNLVSQCANLRAQRDLLLPKLISGEIDLSAAAPLRQEAAE